ncbi:MAG TPA: hypothetical protein VFD97_06325 [Acidimicrobiia bacterium]|nr:hypothetical protein [Acidimicrobiia bacterium]
MGDARSRSNRRLHTDGAADFTVGDPGGDATRFIFGGHDNANVVNESCPRLDFFASRQASRQCRPARSLIAYDH